MSRTIDERVVSLQFDNKHFENNVQTTLSTVGKLEKALKLDGATKGLQNIGTAAKKCDLAPIGDSAQKVGLKFNALYTVADQAFRNMYNSAEAYAKKIVSAFTTDPIKSGFSEYELKMGSVQTIMAGSGESLETVNKYLEELNKYSDKTIYSFSDMTNNIGKFTNAGVKLEDAVKAIQGISNEAALSGANANEASRAMYNFSQALSAGYVKLIDWKSIENANMATVGFKEELIKTAIELGTVTKASDGMYETLEGNAFNATKNFNEVFQDQWLTSDVLIQTLSKYADETTDIGKKAFAAAQDVKTFSMMMDTLKESAQSGWAQTWELIVGDFDDAKNLWTNVTQVLGDIIGGSAEKRNTLLKGALESNWDKMVAKIEEAGVSADDFEKQLSDTMKKAGIPVDNFLKRFGSFENMLKEGVVDASLLTDALAALKKEGNPIFKGIDKITNGMTKDATGEGVKQLQAALTALGYELPKYGIDGIFQEETKATLEAFQKASGLKVTGIVDQETLDMLAKATKGMKNLNFEVDELAKGALELSGRELLLKSFANIFKAIQKPMQAVGKAWSQVIGSMSSETLFNAITAFESFTQKLILSPKSLEKVTRGFAGLFSIVKVLGKVVGGSLKLAFTLVNKVLDNFDMNLLDVFGYVGDLLVRFEQWIAKNDYIAKGIQWLADRIADGAKAVKGWIDEFFKLPKVQKFFEKFKAGWTDFTQNFTTHVSNAWTAVKGFFKTIYESDKVQSFLTKLKDGCSNVFGNIKERLSGLTDAFKEFFKNLGSGNGSFKESFATFKDSIVEYFSNIDYKAIAKTILSKIGNFIKTLVVNIVDIGKAVFGAIGTFLKNAWGAFEGIGKFIKENIGSILALASIALLLSTLRKIKMAVELISGPIEAIQEALTGLTAAAKRAATAALIKNLGISIGIIAASIAVLAQIPRGDLWNAVGAVGAIGIILGALTFFMAKTVKNLNTKDTAVLSAYLLSIGGAMILMALTAKIMGSLSGDQWLKGVGAVVIFIGMMTVVAKAVSKIDKDVSKFGTLMLKISASLIVLAIAMKMFAKMDGDVILKGGGVIIGFLTVMTFMMKSTSKVGSEADKFGKMMLSISAGLILMAYAVKILGKMDPKELAQGGLAIGALMLIVGLMTKMTKIGAGEKSGAYSFGKMMSGIGTALLLMSASILILGKMDIKDLIQGGIAVGVLMGIMAAMIAATKLLGKNTKDLSKLGTMMIGLGAALLLISGSIILLGLLDEEKLKRGLFAVSAIGIIFAALVSVSKGIKGLKLGPIIGIAFSIVLLAASVAALSMIPEDDLKNATTCMTVLMLSLAVVMKSASSMKRLSGKALIGILAVAAMVAGVAYLMKLLTDKIKDPDGALKIAVGLSALLLAISGALYIVAKVASMASTISSRGIKTAIGLLGVVAIAVGGLAAIAIWQMPNIAKQLSSFMTELQGFITGAKNIDQDTLTAIKTLAEVMTIMGGASIKFGISKLFGVDALTEFKEFIVAAIPVVQQMAVEISNSDVKIDSKKVGVIVTTLKDLAEAANNVPSFAAGGGLGFGKGIFGAAGGVMIPQLEKFTAFIKEAVPIVKDMAIAVSVKGVNINALAVESIVGAVGALAEAANNAPSINVDVGGGGANGKMAMYASVSIPNLTKFKEFVIGASGALKDFGIGLSGVELKIETVQGICDVVGSLGTVANSIPVIKAGGGFGKFKSFIGIVGGAEFPLLGQFTTFIQTSLTTIGDFSNSLNGKTGDSYDISEEKLTLIKGVCDCVTQLSTAAVNVPKAEAFANITGAGGRLKGVSISAGGSWPDFENTVAFFKSACNTVKDLALDPELPDIDEEKASTLASLCTCVGLLGDAAGSVPESSKLQAIGAAGGRIGLGGVAIDGGSWPDFDGTIKFMNAIIPLMPTLVAPVSGANIDEGDLNNLKSICEAVGVLASATGELNQDGTVDIAGVFANANLSGLTVGGVEGSANWTTNFQGAVDFFNAVIPAVTGWTATISEAKIKSSDAETLKSIAGGALALGQAASSLQTEGSAHIGGGFAGIVGGMSGFAGVIEGNAEWSTDYTAAKTFFEGIIPVLTGWAVTISESEIDEEDGKKLLQLANGAKVLAEAAGACPTEKEAEALFGFVDYSEKAQLTEFGSFVETVSKALSGWAFTIHDLAITDEDIEKIMTLCTAVDKLSIAAGHVPTKEEFTWGKDGISYVEAADFEGFRTWLEGDGGANGGICGSINKIKDALIDMEWDMSLAGQIQAFGRAVEALTIAASYIPTTEDAEGLWYHRITSTDFAGFTEWLLQLGQAVAEFDEKVGIIDTTTVTAAANAIKNIGEGIGHLYTELGDYVISSNGLDDKIERFKTMLSGIEDGLYQLQGDIETHKLDVSTIETVTTAFSKAMNGLTKLAEIDYDKINIPAFEDVVKKAAGAINTFAGSVEYPDNVTTTTDTIQKIVNLFTSMGDDMYDKAYGFKEALNAFNGSNAVSGFVTAFTNENLGTARTNFQNLVSDMTTLITKGISKDTSEDFVAALGTLANSGVDEFISAFETADDDSGITTAVEGMVNAAKSAAGSETMVSNFVSIGENLASGLATGISNKSSSVSSAAKQVAVDAYNAAMKELEINSPSKKFMRLGYGIDEGFVKGIDGMSHLVTRSAVNVADTAIEGTKSVISRLASAIDSDIDTQPTIRPVLDLSDISSGASAINGMLGMRPSVRTLANVGYLSASVTNRQNGSNSDVISAIEKLGSKLGKTGPTYQIGDVSYNDDSAINNAMGQLVRAIRVERRK